MSARPCIALATGALLGLSSTACQTPQRGPVFAPLHGVLAPEQARSEARQLKDPAQAVELAWHQGNDRGYARQRLDEGIERAPKKAPLRLRRAVLNYTELRLADSVRDLAALVQDRPESAEAELALVLLQDMFDLVPTQHQAIAQAIEASGLLEDRPAATAGRVTLAAALTARIAHRADQDERAQEVLARAGFVSQMRSIGPLAPAVAISMAEDSRYESTGDWSMVRHFRGRPAPVQTVKGHGAPWLNAPSGPPGLYVFDAYFEVSDRAHQASLMLQAHLPDSARVSIDGQVVLHKDGAQRREGRLAQVPLRLAPGWHRVAIAMITRAQERFSIALTTRDGRAVTTQSRSGQLLGALPAPRASVGSIIVDQQGDRSPWGLVHQLIQDERHTVFARLLGQRLALTDWCYDPDRAWWMLHGLQEALPNSASVRFAQARTHADLGLQGLAQGMLQTGLLHDPQHPGAQIAFARLIADERPQKALKRLKAVRSQRPEAWQPHAAEAAIYRRLGWNAETARAFDAAIALGAPDRVLRTAMRFFRGIDHLSAADSTQSILHRRVPRDRPQYAAQRAERQGRNDEAVESWLQAATGRRRTRALTRVAELELARLRPQAAARRAQDVLREQPNHAPALTAALQASMMLKDEAQSQAILQRLRDLGQSTLELELMVDELNSAADPKAEASPYDPWLGVRAPGPDALPPGLDPADRWAQFDSVVLLEKTVDRVRPDGSALSLRHAIVRLQTKEATDRAGEFGSAPEAMVLAARTLKSDGRSVPADRHAGKEDLSFSALAPGDAVQRKWIEISSPATAWGGYLKRFRFHGSSPVVRTERVVIVPKGAQLWTHSYHGAPEPIVTHGPTESVYRWRGRDISPVAPEPHATSANESLPFVVVSVNLDAIAPRATPLLGTLETLRGSQQVDHLARALTATISAPQAKLTHLYRYVIAHIDDGPARPPERVLTTGRGERSGLLVALARASGLQSDVVWAAAGIAPQLQPAYPDSEAFSTRLVRTQLPNGAVMWANLEDQQTWLGQLPPHFEGGRFIRARANDLHVEHIEPSQVDAWRAHTQVELTVDALGQATGHVRLTIPSGYAGPLRAFFGSAQARDIQQQLQGLSATLLPSARLIAHRAEPLQDHLRDLTIDLELEVPFFMSRQGSELVAEQFFGTPLTLRTMGLPTLQTYLTVPVRHRPLLVRPVAETMVVTVNLPPTTDAILAAPRTVSSKVPGCTITQRVEASQDGQRLQLHMRYDTKLQRVAPSAYPDFAAAAQDTLQALRNRLVITVGTRPQGTARANNAPTR